VHLTVLAHECSEPIESRFSVDSDCHIRTQITVLEEVFLDARKTLLQVVDNLTTFGFAQSRESKTLRGYVLLP